MGPTASGKTQAALEISKIIPCEMISCDSMQVYRGMPILTQAPAVKIRGQLKSHLVSFLNPSEEYSAARFREDARRLIPGILKRKKVPLVVGGTGLYLRALLDGLFASAGPVFRDEAYRQKLNAAQEKHGGDFLHQKLEAVDPVSAKKIHPNDVRRLVRVLEIYHLSGKSFSEQKTNRSGVRGLYDVRIYLLDHDRRALYERINGRVDAMIKEGLIGEVKRLLGKKMSMTAGMALGFREISSYLAGKISLPEALEALKKNTRRYAKRQLSWFRHEKGVEAVPVGPKDTAMAIAREVMRRFTTSPLPNLPLRKGEGDKGHV